MLVIIMINIDAYWYFFAFSDLTCYLENKGIGLSGYTVTSDIKETKHGSRNQDVSS